MGGLFENYIQSISSKFSHAETSEMGYRTDFENLIKEIFEAIKVYRIDHDAKAEKGNKPDFVVLKYDVPILYIETKDIGVYLDKVEKSEQMARYYGYTNLVLTNYVEFRFYRNGIRYEEPIKIANYDIKNRIISPIPENYEHIAKSLVEFTQTYKEPIRSGEHLAKIMGGKAQRIRDNVRQFFVSESDKSIELFHVYETVKKLLVHDLTPDAFSDMYAQTLVYGLFVARYYDESPDTFTRQEARDLVPDSNPFLGHFFDHIVGRNFDKRLEYIVNELCEVFAHSNVKELMGQYFKTDLFDKTHEEPDPVIHFYEDFLKEYDPELRKKMGAYYTPLPVVRFIVRAVDKILEMDFGLVRGLADNVKNTAGIHRVQILDPAVGTGTFISAIIRAIYERILKAKQEGSWPAYVHHDLLPRIHGFELMMAPYTIAHLKLSMAFEKTGFWKFHRRLGIYLTNSLEESPIQKDLFTGFGFAESIAEESKEASVIKNKTPIMVVVGNPPYSVSSSNKGEWIQNLIKDYKKGLGERKINLDDDYIKFIRFAEHFIEKNKSGIVAMITNNSFIDGITHRQMRKHLLETFNDIYILDLHGNSKKKEKAPDGRKDENVFDIQQGVSINVFVREEGEKKGLGTVRHAELYGKRENKFETLSKNDITTIKWKKLNSPEPYYFFVPKDFGVEAEYSKGFKVDELFNIFSVGIGTKVDSISVDFDKDKLIRRVIDILNNKYKKESLILKFELENNTTWEYERALNATFEENKIVEYDYRPFDKRYTFYDHDFLSRGRRNVMDNFFNKNNYGLELGRTSFVAFISKDLSDEHFGGPKSYKFPLYIWAAGKNRTPNFKKSIIEEIEKIIGKASPEDIFDYIYAVLHSPSYREKYKEFLKIDFPRIPYPKNKISFKKLVAFGTELRSLHLLESPKINKFITTYPITGSDTTDKITYKDNKVFINNDQYFGNVSELAWNFYVGGYQPAQKWLKDRKGRTLTNADIEHYQKIIVALTETDKIMKEIDKIYVKKAR
ncbi:MAG: N-6 DNA methylase [Candidatus Pacebacteria bacterium]|nr:N-6 DNA methylase [Candidatus Paceibacterota bacterium]